MNRTAGAAAIVAFALAQIGKPYSEQSPAGSDGDGHFWSPGQPTPKAFDCSGLAYASCRAAGVVISNGNAEQQWEQHLGGIVDPSEPLQPGDIGAFLGAENIPGYAGHTGIVVRYDPHTDGGVLVNAYDTQYGVCTIPYSRPQAGNGNNGLGVLGFYRPANVLPAPPPPAPPSPEPNPAHPRPAGPPPVLRIDAPAIPGPWMAYLQSLLRLPITGKFDVRDQQDIEQFQRQHHEYANGIVDAATWALLGVH